jgi:hypothetical protein
MDRSTPNLPLIIERIEFVEIVEVLSVLACVASEEKELVIEATANRP